MHILGVFPLLSINVIVLYRPWEGIRRQLHATIDLSSCDLITLLHMVSMASKGPTGRCFKCLDITLT